MTLWGWLDCKSSVDELLLSGSDLAGALGQASISPILEGEGSGPAWDIGFSCLIVIGDTD